MTMDEIIKEIADNAYREWMAQVDCPDAKKLTDITQRHFDRAYECGDIPNRTMVSRVDTPCGATFIRLSHGEEFLSWYQIRFECSKKDCPHAATCGSGESKCAVHKLMQMV